MSAFNALLLDAYRQLNARKLFWITLVISGVLVLGYASIGFDEDGMSMFFGLTEIDNDLFTAGSMGARMLYRGLFSSFIVGIWLAWVATILALISTTTIFPDFVSEGSVELVLSKPISRLRLFIIKYVTSLLFVVLQVGLFCLGIFFCMAWRLGEWNWLVFAAVPIVTIFYSYLYSVNVLVGVVTRSALTALLVTLLFWFSLWSLNVADGTFLQFGTPMRMEQERVDEQVRGLEARVREADPSTRPQLQARLDEQRAAAETTRQPLERLEGWHRRVRMIQAPLPKTSETIGLLDRWLSEESDVNLMDLLSGNVTVTPSGEYVPRHRGEERETQTRVIEEYESRSMWWIVGTSLGFELIVLALAALVFVRRDY